MIASQMGDTRYRGKLIWMLLTSRPDLLPIDLKRQGRAEVHLPLFSPRDLDEVRFMIKVMAKKNKASLDPDAVPETIAEKGLSGADIESIVLAAKRHALSEGRDRLTRNDLEGAMNDFIPSAQGLEKEKQELAAVLECTSMSFLPDEWGNRILQPDGRTKIQERMAAIRAKNELDGFTTAAVPADAPRFTISRNKMRKDRHESSAHRDWLDSKSETPVIQEHVERLGSFMEAMADGKITDDELKDQESRVVAIMKKVEPQLNDQVHADVTQLLCELSAYNIMHTLHGLLQARPKTKFRG